MTQDGIKMALRNPGEYALSGSLVAKPDQVMSVVTMLATVVFFSSAIDLRVIIVTDGSIHRRRKRNDQ